MFSMVIASSLDIVVTFSRSVFIDPMSAVIVTVVFLFLFFFFFFFFFEGFV